MSIQNISTQHEPKNFELEAVVDQYSQERPPTARVTARTMRRADRALQRSSGNLSKRAGFAKRRLGALASIAVLAAGAGVATGSIASGNQQPTPKNILLPSGEVPPHGEFTLTHTVSEGDTGMEQIAEDLADAHPDIGVTAPEIQATLQEVETYGQPGIQVAGDGVLQVGEKLEAPVTIQRPQE